MATGKTTGAVASIEIEPAKSVMESAKSTDQPSQSETNLPIINDKTVKIIGVKEAIHMDSQIEVFGNLSVDNHIITKPSEEIEEGIIN